MKTIIVGCGRAGAELANRLFEKGHKVSIVDLNAQAFNNLPMGFRGHTVEGDGLNQDVLQSAGIKDADALATMTNLDSLNIVVAHTARIVYQVPRIVARNYDPHTRPVYEAFGIQFFSSVIWGAQRFEEVLNEEARAIFSAGNGEVAIYEVTTPLAWVGKPLSAIMSEGIVLAAITRSGRATLPRANQLIEANDLLHLSATPAAMATLSQRLKEA